MAARVKDMMRVQWHILRKNNIRNSFLTIRSFATAIKVELGQGDETKHRNLYEIYHKKKIMDEQSDDEKFGPILKDFETRLQEERQKDITKELSIELKKGEWTEKSVRSGAVGVKIGMTYLWRKDGKATRATLIQLKDCQVMDSRFGRDDGGKNHHTEVIVGCANQDKLSELSEGDFGQYVKYGIPPKKKLHGFACTQDALLPSGTNIQATHFVPGQYLRLAGVSTKLGFQGVMKRWGMKGQPASHGQTKTHRKMGATGGGGSPGRIFPGKRMAGHMGGNRTVLPSVKLLRINTKYNVLFVSGQVFGEKGDFVKIQDSKSGKQKFKTPPPFPTFIPDPEETLPEDIYSDDIRPYTEESFTFRGDS